MSAQASLIYYCVGFEVLVQDMQPWKTGVWKEREKSWVSPQTSIMARGMPLGLCVCFLSLSAAVAVHPDRAHGSSGESAEFLPLMDAWKHFLNLTTR